MHGNNDKHFKVSILAVQNQFGGHICDALLYI